MGTPSKGSETTTFKLLAKTQAEEDAYNYVEHRVLEKPTGVLETIMHLVKGALGAGILSSHVAFKTSGWFVGTLLAILSALYMGYCLYLMVASAQVLYRRCRVPNLSYPDLGEAAFACCKSPKIAKYAKAFRYTIDIMISIDLFGSCATYQIIVAKSIKQLVENVQLSTFEGMYGYPNLRVYLAILIIPTILICLIRHLKWLAPLSLAANFLIMFCMGVSVYYAFENNPTFSGMAAYTSFYEFFEFLGMIVFSMSCVGVVLPVENNMKDPKHFGLALFIGYILIFSSVYSIAFFGYAAFLDKCESPITVNFQLNSMGKFIKGSMVIMIIVTYALNFWVPFTTVFVYLKKRHDPAKHVQWELFYRTLFVIIISVVAIVFPTITHLMGLLGAFCLTNLALIFPNLIHLLVIWERPGFGKYKWRLYFASLMIVFAIFIGICGTTVSMIELLKVAVSH